MGKNNDADQSVSTRCLQLIRELVAPLVFGWKQTGHMGDTNYLFVLIIIHHHMLKNM